MGAADDDVALSVALADCGRPLKLGAELAADDAGEQPLTTSPITAQDAKTNPRNFTDSPLSSSEGQKAELAHSPDTRCWQSVAADLRTLHQSLVGMSGWFTSQIPTAHADERARRQRRAIGSRNCPQQSRTLGNVDPLAFEYRLIGNRFCDVLFRVNDAELDLHQIGDSPDPLEELMNAALALARGEEPPQVFWDPEDGGLFSWSIERSADQLHLRVDYVNDQDHRRRGPVPDVPATPFVAMMSVQRFCSLVAEGAARAIERYGSDRYRELWLSPFPAALLQDLESAANALD